MRRETRSCRRSTASLRSSRPRSAASSSSSSSSAIRGAGYTLQQAALGNDYPLTQALLLVFALCPIVANFIMDLLNLVLDPRVRTA
jgi:hypothetical protein